MSSPYADLEKYTQHPQMTDLALSRDGTRLVAVVQEPDEAASRYVPKLWEIPLEGGDPKRLTTSGAAESGPVFRADGSLVFVSSSLGPNSSGRSVLGGPALWALDLDGRRRLLAEKAGGLSAPLAANDSDTLVALGSRLVSSTPHDDASRRTLRGTRGVTGILHTGMPVRHPFHELDITYPQLLLIESSGEPLGSELLDLVPDAGNALVATNALAGPGISISADGKTIVTQWSRRRRGGSFLPGLMLINTQTQQRTPLLPAEDVLCMSPRISPDAARVAVLAQQEGTFDTPIDIAVRIAAVDGSTSVDAELGDLYPSELVWAPDSLTLYVSGDLHGRGAVLAVDPLTGTVRARLATDAVYRQLRPAPDGRTLYALRTTVDTAPAPVRLNVHAVDQDPAFLPNPVGAAPLPGRMQSVEVTLSDGTGTVHGYLCLPEGTDAESPAPLMQWIHGGPLASHNAWSWRANPWVFVAHGWAVLLPDPALSTGYGPAWIARAWPHRAARVWADLEGLLDSVLARPDIDGDRTACLGASFGGFMTNWIAGHTNRFRAIITHAGLYALDQHHDTTDAAYLKNSWFGTRNDHPQWYAENSPEEFAHNIRTPMLITHGNGDYNVPITEALRLWWDLISTWPGEPDTVPHRFLQFTTEHHWILGLANTEVWYQTVLSFCAEHVLGHEPTISALL